MYIVRNIVTYKGNKYEVLQNPDGLGRVVRVIISDDDYDYIEDIDLCIAVIELLDSQ